MTPEQQAQKLAEWLDSHPGAEPPAGLEPDVVEAVYALRPDLAPAPRVSVDDILGAVTSGPLAQGGGAAVADADDEASGAAVVPFPSVGATVAPKTPGRWGRWALGAGTGTLLAMAAAALLVVRVVAVDSAPEARQVAKVEATATASGVEAAREMPTVEEKEADAEPEVADLDDDFVDDFAGDGAGDRMGSLGSGIGGQADPRSALEGASGESVRERVALDIPSPLVRPTPRPAPSPSPTGTSTLARPAPTPAPMVATAPAAAARGPVATRPSEDFAPAVTTTPISQPIDAIADESVDAPAVADLEEDVGRRDTVGYAREEVQAAPPRASRDVEVTAAQSAPGADRPIAMGADDSSRDQKPNAESISEARSPFGRREPTRRGSAVAESAEAEETPYEPDGGDAGGVLGGVVAAEPAVEAKDLPGLDALRARAVPTDLPQSELLSRSITPANEDARGYAADGRFVEAGNALVPTLSLPAPEGSTNAAQAATWFLAGGDPALARTAAETGLSNTSGNTPERSWLYVLYGDSLRRAGDSAGATRAYAEAIELNDDRRGATESAPVETSDPGR